MSNLECRLSAVLKMMAMHEAAALQDNGGFWQEESSLGKGGLTAQAPVLQAARRARPRRCSRARA